MKLPRRTPCVVRTLPPMLAPVIILALLTALVATESDATG